MHKIGLKLWSLNTDAYYTEAQKLYAQGVFDYIELYVLPDSLDHLKKWKNLKIPYIIHCAHSAHGFNLADKTLEDSNRRIYEQSKRYADELEARYIIFHGGCDGTIEETARQLANFHEPRALIENKPMKPLPDSFHSVECRGFSLEELEVVINTCTCGFCLDIGHAFCAANSLRYFPYDYIRNLNETLHPVMYHLSDIENDNSVYDSHLHLGTGILNLLEVLDWIPDYSRISIETMKNTPDSLADFVKDVFFLKKEWKK